MCVNIDKPRLRTVALTHTHTSTLYTHAPHANDAMRAALSEMARAMPRAKEHATLRRPCAATPPSPFLSLVVLLLATGGASAAVTIFTVEPPPSSCLRNWVDGPTCNPL